MALCHTEVRLTLTDTILQGLRLQGYSHPGLEKVYSEADMNSRDAIETNGDSLRQVKDFKVRPHRPLSDVSLNLNRKATRLAARRTQRSKTYGSRKKSCRGSGLP